MITFDGPVQARNALSDFLMQQKEKVPKDLREHLRELVKEISPVVSSVRGAEAVFARNELEHDVGEDLKEWAAATAVMSEAHGFSMMQVGSRGSRIAKRLRGQDLPPSELPQLMVEIANVVAPPQEEKVAEEDENG